MQVKTKTLHLQYQIGKQRTKICCFSNLMHLMVQKYLQQQDMFVESE